MTAAVRGGYSLTGGPTLLDKYDTTEGAPSERLKCGMVPRGSGSKD